MRRHRRAILSTIALLVSPVIGAAQAGSPGDITFTVPVHLTQLSIGVSKVRVTCSITSEAITVNREVVGKSVNGPATGPGSVSKSEEFAVSGGQVNTTATLVVSTAGVRDNPAGKLANYACRLDGFSVAQQRFVPFNYALPIADTEPALRLNYNGPVAQTGSFTW